jgi:hypothetical protein
VKATLWPHGFDLPYPRGLGKQWLQVGGCGVRGMSGTLIRSELFAFPGEEDDLGSCAYARRLYVRERTSHDGGRLWINEVSRP